MKAVVKRGVSSGTKRFGDLEEGDWFLDARNCLCSKLDSYNRDDDINTVWYDDVTETLNVHYTSDDALVTPIQVTITY